MAKIRKFKPKDTRNIAKLIKSTFLRYNRNEGGKKSVERYVSRYSLGGLGELADRLKDDSILYVAEEGHKLIGVIRGDEHRVFQLFVDGKFHGKGVGRMLMGRFEREARKKGSRYININSSLYATRFYQRLGYGKTTGIRSSAKRFGDIKYQPMRKELK